MNVATLAARNVLRNKFRTTLTILGVAVAIVAFLMLRTVVAAWNVGVDAAAQDRIGTRHKVSIVMALPKRYIETLRQIPGIRESTYANWVGLQNPRNKQDFFASLAVESRTFFKVYDEMRLEPGVYEQWMEKRNGAILGDTLAQKLNVRPGDRVTLSGTIYPGDWQFEVVGIYTATRKSVDRSQFIFHWDYLNDAIPEARRDQIGWMISRINDSSQAAALARKVDQVFDSQDVQTLSMSERAMNMSFLGMFSMLLSALDIVSIIILLILLLILGNTVAMGVRERTNEYGVLRALGFLPQHIATFIITESVITGALAGVVGLLLAYPIVQLGIGRFIEENMGGFFPYFRIDPASAIAALVFAIVLGLAAAALPAWRASRLTVTDALRRID